MASTLNVWSTLEWAWPYVRFQPLTIGGQEPALTAANMTKDLMLAPPFKWPWNRSTLNYTCDTGVQDYSVGVADFGFIEVASVAAIDQQNKQMTVQRVLALDGTQSDRPAYIAAQTDDGQGNITFRLSPPPDQQYLVTVTYQRKSIPILSLAGRWTPIPDDLAHIPNWGFLTLAAMLTGDARMPVFSQKFVGHLLSVQSGLTETEINIFMATYMQRTGQITAAGLATQQGASARTL